VKLTDLSTNMSGAAAIIAIIVAVYGFYKWSYRRGHNDANLNEYWKKKDDAFTNVYAPLRAALLNTKFVVCSSTGYPTFKLRFSNAVDVFSTRKYLKSKIKGFIAALSDKAESMSVECETNFPQSKIKSIVESYPQMADRELINKVHEIEVMSSTPWENDEDQIVEKQYSLAEYIYTRYESIEQDLHNKALQRTSR
jgi:hypothetical protein